MDRINRIDFQAQIIQVKAKFDEKRFFFLNQHMNRMLKSNVGNAAVFIFWLSPFAAVKSFILFFILSRNQMLNKQDG